MRRFVPVRFIMLPLLGVTALVAAGCATSKSATAEKLAVVEKAIDEARDGTARTSAPVELRTAEDKYAAAQSAMKREEFDVANRLADEALADAEFAHAKAESAKTRKMTNDLKDSIKMLKDEIERIPGR